MLRLVRIRGARVYYSDSVPETGRRKRAAESLQAGAEVRVTAQEDGHARWYAQEVEILSLPPAREAQK